MICRKCNGQGVVTKVTQLSGEGDDVLIGNMAAIMSCGLSYLVTTRLKEVRCPRCGGTGEIGRLI